MKSPKDFYQLGRFLIQKTPCPQPATKLGKKLKYNYTKSCNTEPERENSSYQQEMIEIRNKYKNRGWSGNHSTH